MNDLAILTIKNHIRILSVSINNKTIHHLPLHISKKQKFVLTPKQIKQFTSLKAGALKNYIGKLDTIKIGTIKLSDWQTHFIKLFENEARKNFNKIHLIVVNEKLYTQIGKTQFTNGARKILQWYKDFTPTKLRTYSRNFTLQQSKENIEKSDNFKMNEEEFTGQQLSDIFETEKIAFDQKDAIHQLAVISIAKQMGFSNNHSSLLLFLFLSAMDCIIKSKQYKNITSVMVFNDCLGSYRLPNNNRTNNNTSPSITPNNWFDDALLTKLSQLFQNKNSMGVIMNKANQAIIQYNVGILKNYEFEQFNEADFSFNASKANITKFLQLKYLQITNDKKKVNSLDYFNKRGQFVTAIRQTLSHFECFKCAYDEREYFKQLKSDFLFSNTNIERPYVIMSIKNNNFEFTSVEFMDLTIIGGNNDGVFMVNIEGKKKTNVPPKEKQDILKKLKNCHPRPIAGLSIYLHIGDGSMKEYSFF